MNDKEASRNRSIEDESFEAWEVEIRSLAAGKRDYLLIGLGSVVGYLSKLLSNSFNLAIAETNLRQAVKNVVNGWHPEKIEADYQTLILLEIIGAYQPPEGFVRIAGFMQRGHYFPTMQREFGGYGAGQDLHMKALLSLEYYYPTAPPKSDIDPAFKSYIQILEQHLTNEQYCSYVVGRLIALNALDTDDAELCRPIEMNLLTIDEIVPVVLGPARRARLKEELSNVYTHCVLVGRSATERFQSVLNRSGIDSDVDKDGFRLRITVPGIRESIMLDVTDKFVITVLERGSELGWEVAMDMREKFKVSSEQS